MLKKVRIIFLTLLLCLSLLPIADAASSKAVHIDSVKVDYDTLNVTVKGYVENYVKVSIPQHIMLSVTDNNGEYQQITEFEPERNGTFSYTYEHNQKNAVDSCTVTAKFLDSPYTDTAFYSIAGENQYEIFGNAIVFMKNSPTYFANGIKCETEKVPYIENNEVFVPYTDEIKALGYECESEYIKLSEIENTYSDDEFFAIGEFDASVVNSIPVYFGIYVSSESGSDNNSGLFNAPVKTIEKALEIRAASNGNPTIYLVGNEYRFDSTLSLDSSHSNLSVKAYPNTNPLIKKSVYLSEDMFTEITEEDSALFKENVKDNILVASFETIKSSLASYEYSVFDNNIRADNSRWPNGNQFAETSPVITDYDESEKVNPDPPATNNTEAIYIDSDKAEEWQNVNDGIIAIYNRTGYATYRRKIVSTDTTVSTLTMNRKANELGVGNRYYVENISYELDIPGEYYINPEQTKIYYYPKENFEGLEITADTNPVVEISGAQNITFDKISFAQSGGDLINIKNSDGITVLGGELYGSTENGVDAQQVTNCKFDGITAYDFGSYAFNVNFTKETDKIKNLEHENNIISNCDVSDYGRISLMSRGIAIRGCGNKIENNIIHNALAPGAYIIGAENSFINNDIYGVSRLTNDNGLVYLAGITSAGNIISGNIIHDEPYDYTKDGAEKFSDWYWGIYLDNALSGVTIENNYIYNVPYGMNMNGGSNNTVKNNVFAQTNCIELQDILSHGKNYHSSILANGSSYNALENIFGESSTYDKEVWKEKYSYLYDIYDIAKTNICETNCDTTFGRPKNVVVTNNIIAGISGTKGGRIKINPNIQCYSDSDVQNTDYITSVTEEKYKNNVSGNTYLTASDFEAGKATYLSKLDLSDSGIISENVKAMLSAPTVRFPYDNKAYSEAVNEIVWDKTKTADKYRVIVSENADLSNPLYDVTSYSTALDLGELEEGKYYYRVDSIRNAYHFNEAVQGEIRSFTIKAPDKVSVEKIATGLDNKVGAKIIPNVSETLNFDVIFAEKNDSGKVINVEIITKNNFTSSSDGNVYYTLTDTKNKVEIFIWNGLTPLTDKNNLK